MAPVGQKVVETLEDHFHPVSIFLGSPSVGKWTTALYLAEHFNVADVDVMTVKRLTINESRAITRFTSLPPTGERKLVIIRLSGATEAAQNALLKTLEESPAWVHFILVGQSAPIPTITSRAQTFRFTPLAAEDVSQILQRVKRMTPGAAKVLSERSKGSVKEALNYHHTNELKPQVAIVLRAFRERNPNILEKVALSWTEEHTDLLTNWCYERMSGRWKIFSEAESGIDDDRVPMRILQALNTPVRPRLVIRSSLMSVLRRMT